LIVGIALWPVLASLIMVIIMQHMLSTNPKLRLVTLNLCHTYPMLLLNNPILQSNHQNLLNCGLVVGTSIVSDIKIWVLPTPQHKNATNNAKKLSGASTLQWVVMVVLIAL